MILVIDSAIKLNDMAVLVMLENHANGIMMLGYFTQRLDEAR